MLLGLNLLRCEVNVDWGNVMSLALLPLLPMLVIFPAFRRYLAGTGPK
jgi:multiple sugar transport system permease protein/alpha-1,4-digalacturonate transport system permease protein